MSEGAVNRQGSAYRNGLVLGLTMAEILLLLLFCMLIALGASMQSERKARREVEERLVQAELAAKGNDALAEAMKSNPQVAQALGSASGPEFDKFWRRLVQGSAVADALEGAGVSRERALSNASQLADADRALREAGGNAANLARDAELGRKARKVLADSGQPSGDASVLEATARGAAAMKDGPQKVAGKGDGEGHKWPPIISLSEADGFYFASGKAELTQDFADKLSKAVIPKIAELARQYDVDTLEVVGHTDEQPMGGRSTNLDKGLPMVLRGQVGVDALAPGDNAGLGLARAVSVVSRLLKDRRLGEFRILPLSGGQLVMNDQTLSDGKHGGDVKDRRRIELRLRKSTTVEAAKSNGGFLPSWLTLPKL